jgi:hypothetical protein
MNHALIQRAATLGLASVTFDLDIRTAAAPAELRGGHAVQARYVGKHGLAIANGQTPEEALERLCGYVEKHPLQQPSDKLVANLPEGVHELAEGVHLHVHVTRVEPADAPAVSPPPSSLTEGGAEA